MHTCMHTYMHAYIHTYMHAYIHTYNYMRAYGTYTYAYVCTIHVQQSAGMLRRALWRQPSSFLSFFFVYVFSGYTYMQRDPDHTTPQDSSACMKGESSNLVLLQQASWRLRQVVVPFERPGKHLSLAKKTTYVRVYTYISIYVYIV